MDSIHYMQSKIFKLISIFTILFLVLGLSSCVDKDNNKTNDNKETAQPKIIQKQTQLTLIMGGDALLHAPVYKDAQIIKQNNMQQTQINYDFSRMFDMLSPLIKRYDLAFYNQETILGGKELGLSSYPAFNSPQEFGDSMIDIGFNLISLANNHTLDRGEKAIMSSLKYWSNKPVLTAGSYQSFKDRNTPKIYEKNGIKYTMLAYTYGTNGIKIPKGKDYLVNIYSKEVLQKDIKQVRDKVDLLIVSMHWGNEYQFTPNKEQEELAKFLAKQNVDIIIGNHPHVIQPIEWINNTLVIYSLGNMISAQRGLERRIGMLVDVRVIKDLQTGTISLKDLHANLIYTYYDDFIRNFRIYTFSQLSEEILPNYKYICKKYSQIVKKRDISDSVIVCK